MLDIIITGPQGSGKTILAGNLVKEHFKSSHVLFSERLPSHKAQLPSFVSVVVFDGCLYSSNELKVALGIVSNWRTKYNKYLQAIYIHQGDATELIK